MEIDLGFTQFTIDFVDIGNNFLNFFVAQDPAVVVWELFLIFGWLFLVYGGFYLALEQYQEYRQNLHTKDWKFIVLAVDIPAMNVQTPKAVEQMFSHIAGALSNPNIGEKYRGGYVQRLFSFEIVSIEGYIQFIIYTEQKYRDLVEASVYAQYPEAEITEVEDYVTSIPNRYPNDTHEMWAAEFILNEDQAYPLRSYREFEHSISKDTVLKDPMGTFLESFSRIGPGEQMWFQIVVVPTANSWKEKNINKIKEIIGDKSFKKGGGGRVSNSLYNVADQGSKLIEKIGDEVFGREASAASDAKSDDGDPNQLRFLTPGQVKIVESMEDKISKLGFTCMVRGMYLARKEVFRPERGVNAMIGAINQFNSPSSNSLVPGFTSGGASYFFAKQRNAFRKALLMKAYKKRKPKSGANPYILNIEELATLWHFPMSHVATPNIQKAGAKQAEPPVNLPAESVPSPLAPQPSEQELREKQNPRYHTDSGALGYDDGQEFG